MLNLLGNSIKFTLKGEIKVKISLCKSEIFKCSVTDTGVGMKEEQMKKLFLPFGKGEDKEGINKNGCGLGLAISRSLAENLGGQITAKSSLNCGSTFTFTISANLNGYLEETGKESANSGRKIKTFESSNNLIYGKVKRTLSIMNSQLNTPSHNDSSHDLTAEVMEKEKTCTCKKLLIVEDNPINLLALKQLCLKFGVEADEVRFLN